MSSLATSLMSYQSLRSSSVIKDADEKRAANREKAMLVFAFQLLVDKGYLDTATSLTNECSVKLDEFSICENIDLRAVFVEFETYYHLRYQRYPQYFKKATPTSATEELLEKMRANPMHLVNMQGRKGSGKVKDRKFGITKPVGIAGNQKCLEADYAGGGSGMMMVGSSCTDNGNSDGLISNAGPSSSSTEDFKLIKPISGIDFSNDDLRGFAEIIQKEIVVSSLHTKWEDVIGLESAKTVLKETLMYTKDFMEFFGQGITPWKGMLLYGPPGVGKTLLAKAVATECGTTFFNISSASIVSKWRGDSEKIVKTLFHMARYHAPSTIFFDEFEALGSTRDGGGESDASRRLKSEILQQMDGVLSSSSDHQQLPVFILAATNLPWELDSAILRRLEKRIYVPLPTPANRYGILKHHFERTARSVSESSKNRNSLNSAIDFCLLAHETEGYSGSDLQQIIKESVIRKFRENCGTQKIRVLTIGTEDVCKSIHSIPPTVKNSLAHKFAVWDADYRSSC